MVEPGGSNFDYINASQGVSILENGKSKRVGFANLEWFRVRYLKEITLRQIYNSGSILCLTLIRHFLQIRAWVNSWSHINIIIEAETLRPNQSQQNFAPDNQQFGLTGDYETYILSTMTLKEGSRSQSQGKINVTNKGFDTKTLLLPEIEKNKTSGGMTSQLIDRKLPQINYR